MNDKITCPNCGYSFDVEEALSGKLEAHFKAEYEKKIAQQAEKFKVEKNRLEVKELLTNKESLEKFAREKYLMKKKDEDIFLVVED